MPPDADKDGVLDNLDRCPNTPRGERVDASGCSLPRDSDGDGVMDDRDRCPGTSYGTKVDANGCPDLFKGGQSLVLDGVNFETARSVLTPDSRDILDRVAATLVANPDVRIEVSGHTDSRGSRDMNRGLSRARAQSVLDYLAMQGVARDRMVAAGYGPDQPIDSNDTAEGRARNRRVELRKLN
jgi:OOP family OmpA-OmpF porin